MLASVGISQFRSLYKSFFSLPNAGISSCKLYILRNEGTNIACHYFFIAHSALPVLQLQAADSHRITQTFLFI